jgi:glycerol-3-phosphate acyltransferase PlsY
VSWLAALVLGYLLGSLPFAFLLARWFAGVDLRVTGSGNLGATNVLRSTRWSLALVVLALDVAKGAMAVVIGQSVGASTGAATVAGVAAVAGHVYPAWLRFSGGKGVAPAAGMALVLVPAAALGATVAFLAIVWRTRYVSLGSVTGAVLVPLLAAATGAPWPCIAGTAVVAGLIVFGHRGNLERLRAGTERQLGRRDQAGHCADPSARGR